MGVHRERWLLVGGFGKVNKGGISTEPQKINLGMQRHYYSLVPKGFA